MGTLKIKRGTTSQRQGFTPALAELVYDSDTKEGIRSIRWVL